MPKFPLIQKYLKISVKKLMNLSWIYFTTLDNNLSPQ
nr:MAG TPA: hypothetical protein [Caudoviricetes sp.]